METDETFFSNLFTQIDELLEAGIAESVVNIASFLEPTFHTLLILYFAFQGYELLFSNDKFNAKELAFNNLKIFVIYTLAFEVAIFQNVIQSFFIGENAFSEQLANVMFGGVETSSATSLDNVYGFGGQVVDKIIASSGWFDVIAIFLLGLLVSLILVFLTGYCAFLMIFSKIATAILIALAPIFILALLFAKTGKLFEAWLGQLLNFAFLYLIIAVCIKLFSTGFLQYMQDVLVENNYSVGIISSILLFGVIFLFVMFQASSIASAVSSGVSLSTATGLKGGLTGILRYQMMKKPYNNDK